MIAAIGTNDAEIRTRRRTAAIARDERGFTLIEVFLACIVLIVALVVLAGMFPMGYRQVADAGKMTLAVTAARQILEDVGTVPFANVVNLNAYDTSDSSTLPGGEPERTLARRWRYMVAGPATGFTFSADELAAWSAVVPSGGRATVQVTSPSGTLRQVTVTVGVPGSPSVRLSTVVVALF